MKRVKPTVKKIVAVAAAVSLGSSLAACSVQTEASSSVDASSSSSEDVLTTTAKELLKTTTKSDENGKEETVYVIEDADGNKDKVVVSNWLKNGDGKDELVDKTNLSDIENTKGDETYTENSDGTITWDAHGDDIFYKGTSNEELPVNVKISYKLDGKTISADDLEGASGHLKIEFTYENKVTKTTTINGEKVNLNKPCAVVSGLIMDNENASNVQVTNGKVINDGDRSIVVGLALPGMKENLDLTDLDSEDAEKIEDIIPESVTVEADITDFEMAGTISVASYDISTDVDFSKYDSNIDSLKDSADELQDGTDQIVDGAKTLADYMKQLKDGTDTLSDGTGQLSSGADSLSSGADQLVSGSGSLSSGADSLATGAGQLSSGLEQLKTSVADLPSGANKLYEGAQKLSAALKSGDSSSRDKYGVYEAVTAIGQGADQLKSVLKTIMDGASSIHDGALELAAGAKSGSDNPEEYGIYEAAGALGSTIEQTIAGIKEKLGSAATSLGDANTYGQNAIDIANTLSGDESLTEEQQTYIQQIIAYVSGDMQTVSGVQSALAAVNIDTSQIDAVVSGIQNGAEAIVAGANKIAVGAKSDDTSSLDKYGLYEAAAAAYAGAEELSASASTLAASVDYMAGSDNMGALVSGLESLNSQSSQLISAVGQLSSGADTLSSGAGTLATGAKTLNTGAGTLATGAKTLASGTKSADSGAKTLASAALQLMDGTNTLSDGINTLNEDGISKIVDILGNKAESFYARLKAVVDYAKEGQSFAGATDGTDCTVQYIFKTGDIQGSSDDAD